MALIRRCPSCGTRHIRAWFYDHVWAHIRPEHARSMAFGEGYDYALHVNGITPEDDERAYDAHTAALKGH